METESEKPKSNERSVLRKAGQVGWAFINPFSDLAVIWQRGGRPTVERLGLAWQLLREWSKSGKAGPELTWQQAVDCAGKPIEQIRRSITRARVLWWGLMALTGCLAISLLVVILLAWAGLPATTLLSASVTLLILSCLSGVGFVKSLVATFRLWQLQSERVSVQERGTFQDYLAENRWCTQVLLLKR